MTPATGRHLGKSLGTDFFSVREQFTDEQRSRFITVRRFVDEELVPVAGPYWQAAIVFLRREVAEDARRQLGGSIAGVGSSQLFLYAGT